jgi:hypothetical protein
MTASNRQILSELERLRGDFGPEAAHRKRALLARLATARLATAPEVLALHDLLCFWRAYPDDRALLLQVEAMLAAFGERADLRRHRAALADSGIAGTDLNYEFFMPMARWIAERWPADLTIDWDEYGAGEALEKVLNLLALYAETPGLDELPYSAREWLDRLRGPRETDAAFLVRRIAELPLDTFQREYFYEHLAVPMTLRGTAAAGGPSRTLAHLPGARVHYQTGPLDTRRPELPAAVLEAPERITAVPVRRGRAIIELAREALLTRSRDLDAFSFGDPRDVRLVEAGQGLQFALIGLIPERRLVFEATYGYLTLKNGVPVGYGVVSALFGSVEVAYNVFDAFRGGEAAHIYGRLLAALRQIFAADTFTIFPYQLGGEGNREGLESGAWWFYQKLGFRARDEATRRLMVRELARMKKRRGYRTSLETLAELATENVYYELGRPREDVIGRLALGQVSERVTAFLARRFGARRRRAERICVEEARALLGVPHPRRLRAGERIAWQRWSPLVLALPRIDRWTAADRRALAGVIQAKGGRRESDFVARFDAHRKLRRLIRRLARPE